MTDEMKAIDPDNIDLFVRTFCKAAQIMCEGKGLEYVNIQIEPKRFKFSGYGAYDYCKAEYGKRVVIEDDFTG